jgi:hypothetical protein
MYDEFEEGRDDDEHAVDLRNRIANSLWPAYLFQVWD